MNKILIGTTIIFLLIGLNACSYKPIFLEKNYEFEIEEIILSGEKNINNIINSKLKLIKSTGEKNKKKYNIEIKSTKSRKTVSKNSKGDPLKFEMTILVEYKIIDNENILLSNKIEKKNIYNNDSDQFKLEQTEDIILENLTENASDIIISSIINLDDN